MPVGNSGWNLIEATFESTIRGSSTGPEILLDKRFHSHWHYIDHHKFKPASTDPNVESLVTSSRDELLNFFKKTNCPFSRRLPGVTRARYSLSWWRPRAWNQDHSTWSNASLSMDGEGALCNQNVALLGAVPDATIRGERSA